MTVMPGTTLHDNPRVAHGRRAVTRRVIIHTIQGSALGAESWFKNTAAGGIGAHTIVGLDKVIQTTSLDTFCWHCRNANSDGIGIEHDGFAEFPKSKWLSKARRRQLRMSANRTAWICWHYKLGQPTLGRNVFGHVHVPGNDHVDPGKGWPWTFYMWLCRRAYNNLKKKGKWQ